MEQLILRISKFAKWPSKTLKKPAKPEKFPPGDWERSYSQIGESSRPATALKKLTGSGEPVGLLDSEETAAVLRAKAGSKRNAEIADNSEPFSCGSAAEDAGSPFLRSNQRIPVRRRRSSRFASRFSWPGGWLRYVAGGAVLFIFVLLAAAFLEAKTFLLRNPRFALRTAHSIQVGGNRVVTRDQALAFFAPDIGHSILRVPLAKRQEQLQQIPWVRNATVMRLWPNRVGIALSERTPVAFVRDENAIRLVDDQGVLLGLPDAISQHYSFPVLGGISAADPLAIRAARVQIYLRFAKALDAEGGNISAEVSEVDLSDPEDVRAVFAGSVHQPLVHFGTSNFLPRYLAYQAHLAEWLRQYPQLRSVDMRYGQQVVLDTGATPSADAGLMTLPKPTIAESAGQGAAPEGKHAKAASATVKHTAAARSRSSHRTVRAAKRNSNRKKPERGHPVRNPIMHIVSGR